MDVATRCPVAYSLIHNSKLPRGDVRVTYPPGINNPSDLENHLKNVMKKIKEEIHTGFSKKVHEVKIESAEYTDFEILDIPGLVTGNPDPIVRSIVDGIVEAYVRDPRYSIVLLKVADQIRDNATAALRIHELCTAEKGHATNLPP
ncbi:unnamed protein product, partial [Rotaria sp. Silwood2]